MSDTTGANADDKPDVPIMGELTKLSKDEWAAWTGGMPKADWTGLDTSAALEFTTPNQLRPQYASSAQKGYNFRKSGLEEKFEKTVAIAGRLLREDKNLQALYHMLVMMTPSSSASKET